MPGKDEQSTAELGKTRITPAYAGKSVAQAALNLIMRDHPRLCGEKLCFVRCRGLAAGSPPPMRGKGFWYAATRTASRITPAYAGKRQIRQPQRFSEQDHPRLCGEKILKKNGCEREIRITPAYAGKRQFFVPYFRSRQDHPRLCGEKIMAEHDAEVESGSPPPMRGKAGVLQVQTMGSRITPAYAGKSEKARNCVIFTGDHPRLCGEKQI